MNPYQAAIDSSNRPSNNGGLTGKVQGFYIEAVVQHANGACIVQFRKDVGNGITIKTFLNPVNLEDVKVYGDGTIEEARVKALTDSIKLFKALANEIATPEQVENAFGNLPADDTLFNACVTALQACVPSEPSSVNGTLVVGYNKKGYLSTPTRLQWDASKRKMMPFFAVNGEVQDLPKSLSLTKDVPNQEAGENVAEETKEGLPF